MTFNAATHRVKRLERELAAARPGTFDTLRISLGAKPPDLTAVIERDLFRFRKRLLVELANMRDDGLTRFYKNVASRFRPETKTLLLNARRDLRDVWLRSTPLAKKQHIVDAWLLPAMNRSGIVGVSAPLSVGRIVLDPKNFPMQFAVAILENWQSFRVCGNPDCPTPYFLVARRGQKYCSHSCAVLINVRRFREREAERRARKSQ